MYFLTKFLAKLKIGINEIHENVINNDSNEPVPEYDTAILEHEESNWSLIKERDGWELEDILDLKEIDEATHNLNENVRPEDGRLRPHNRYFLISKRFKEEISAIIVNLEKDL